MPESVPTVPLSPDELRAVTRFAAQWAAALLPAFIAADPDDDRPARALAAAATFADGGPRTAALRTAARDAHRAAATAGTERAALAARACGDAAAAAYLHPIARATQVGHILRAAACAIRTAALDAGDDPTAAATAVSAALSRMCGQADPVVVDVLCRYPPASAGSTPLARLTADLDRALRRTARPGGDPAAGGP